MKINRFRTGNLIQKIRHKVNEFALKGDYINGIESFWSYAKNKLNKFNGVKPEFLICKGAEFNLIIEERVI